MTILSAKNQSVEGTIAMRSLPYWVYYEELTDGGSNIITDADVRRIVESGSYWYLTDPLVLTLRAAAEEIDVNTFDIDIPESDRPIT